MKRTQIRETIFMLLFLAEFYEGAAYEEQVERYVDGLADGRLAELIPAAPDAEELRYISDKLAGIRAEIPAIDAQLNEISEGWRTGRMGRVDLCVLRLAVYEMQCDEEIPTGVAINEAVEIAKKYGGDHSASFVNGLLGKIARGAKEQ